MFLLALTNVGVGWARGYSTYKKTPISDSTIILPYAAMSSFVMTVRFGMNRPHLPVSQIAIGSVIGTGFHLLVGSQLGKAHYLVTHDD